MKRNTRTALANQRKWIDEHGGDLAGYCDRYGEPGLTETWYGNGGSAIYRADKAELNRLQKEARP